MRLIEPRVEYWSELHMLPEQHIARCARVCYGGEYQVHTIEQDRHLCEGLKKHGHNSMFRHGTKYYRIVKGTDQQTKEFLLEHALEYEKDPFLGFWWDGKGPAYMSSNLQVAEERGIGFEEVDAKEILEQCMTYPELFNIFRFTFSIITQISTSRELNRKSPNNIAERSTRYCASKDGIIICKPYWWKDSYNEFPDGLKGDELRDWLRGSSAMQGWVAAERAYVSQLEDGAKAEDARESLPLATATKVIYTYTVEEWRDILNLRLYGKTGKPHPNCIKVMEPLRDGINDFAITHGIDFKL